MGTSGHPHYFAYGSNMSATQMADRCPGAANPREAVLADHAWLCNDRGVATVAPVEGRRVHGVLWDVDDDHLASLDRFEGVSSGLYRRVSHEVALAGSGGAVDAVLYIDDNTEPGPARDGYMDKVIGGAAEHGLPDWWLTYLRGWARAGVPGIRSETTEGPDTLADLLASPGVSESTTLRSAVGFMAIHGGNLEVMTDTIARKAAAVAGASLYVVTHPPDIDHHLPSTRYRPEESERLAGFLDHVDIVFSIHGYGRQGRWTDIMVGGANRAMAGHVAAHIDTHLDGYRAITVLDQIPAGLRGLHPDNPVNRPVHGGVQLELPPRVRGLSPLSPPPGPDGVSPPTAALIDALATAAHTWTQAQ